MCKSNANRGKQPENLPEAATDLTAKPGDYPLGSMESRAAARAVIEERKAEADHNGLLTEIRITEVSAEGQRLAKVMRIPPPGKEQTS